MKIISRPRQGGKTTELLKLMAKNPELDMVTCTQQHADFAYRAARTMGLKLSKERFISTQALSERRPLRGERSYVVDNLDLVLQFLLQGNVDTATFSGSIQWSVEDDKGRLDVTLPPLQQGAA